LSATPDCPITQRFDCTELYAGDNPEVQCLFISQTSAMR